MRLELLRRDPPLRLVLRPDVLRAEVLRPDVLRADVLRLDPLRLDAVLRRLELPDVVRRLLVLRRPVERCEAGISAVATALVSCGISFSR